MFHPLVIAMVMLVMWHEAEKLKDGLSGDLPRDVPVIEHFQRTYYTLVGRAGGFTLLVCAAAALEPDLGPGLFLVGTAFALSLAGTAVEAVSWFALADRAGRARGLEAGAYTPSLVLLPLFPAVAGAVY